MLKVPRITVRIRILKEATSLARTRVIPVSQDYDQIVYFDPGIEKELTVQSGLGASITAHAIIGVERGATTEVRKDAISPFTHKRQHSSNQTQGTKVQ